MLNLLLNTRPALTESPSYGSERTPSRENIPENLHGIVKIRCAAEYTCSGIWFRLFFVCVHLSAFVCVHLSAFVCVHLAFSPLVCLLYPWRCTVSAVEHKMPTDRVAWLWVKENAKESKRAREFVRYCEI